MLVVNRFRVDAATAAQFRDRLDRAVAVLGACPGFAEARSGRNLDDPELWVLVTTWRDVGSYRRALSSYDAKVSVAPLLGEAIDEPSAFEPLDGELNVNTPRQHGRR